MYLYYIYRQYTIKAQRQASIYNREYKVIYYFHNSTYIYIEWARKEEDCGFE